MDSSPDPEPSILVIDDNSDCACGLALALEALGFVTYAAFNGQKGVEAAERIKPGIVILDLRMPGIDGFETCKQIRQSQWAAETIIIALTGSKDKRDAALETGYFAGVFLKPADAGELKGVLDSLWRARNSD